HCQVFSLPSSKQASKGSDSGNWWKKTCPCLPWPDGRKCSSARFRKPRRAAMLTPVETDPSPTPQAVESRDQRRQRLLQQLQAAVAPLLEQMADTLADAPDREIFRSVEVRLRDLGQQVAASAQQTALADR